MYQYTLVEGILYIKRWPLNPEALEFIVLSWLSENNSTKFSNLKTL